MKYLKTYCNIARILLGILFMFSALSKAVNPYGFSVKIGEYLSAFDMGLFSPVAPYLAILIPALEAILAFLLFFRFFPKPSAWIVTILSAFFMLLTLWNLMTDSVGDCGCFGDLIKLSPLVSFLKNVVILAVSVFYLLTVRNVTALTHHRLSRILCFALCSFAVPIYAYNHLPLIDNSGYGEGTVLYNFEETVAPFEYEDDGTTRVSLLYRNKFTDEVCCFRIQDEPWQDSSVWEFVGVEDKAIEKVQFPMLRDDFLNVASDVLSSSDSMLIVVIQDLDVVPDLENVDIRTIALSAFDLCSFNVEHYNSDYSLLKQVMPNAKGGALLLYKGKILKKWAMDDCPYFK